MKDQIHLAQRHPFKFIEFTIYNECVMCKLLVFAIRKRVIMRFVDQRLAVFPRTGPDGKCFWLCAPRGLCHGHPARRCCARAATDSTRAGEGGCALGNLIFGH